MAKPTKITSRPQRIQAVEEPPEESTPIDAEDLGDEFEPFERSQPVQYEQVLSTGSTELDLAISGERIRGGGIPGGIMVEMAGAESTGKTAIMSEIISSTQHRKPKGESEIDDTEGRFGDEHARIYDMELDPKHYHRSHTVEEVMERYKLWEPKSKGISVYALDSLAALSTDMEQADKDEFGARRAKMFGKWFRMHARKMCDPHLLLLCTNQLRDSMKPNAPPTSPGGRAIRFYSSLRLQLSKPYPQWEITRTITNRYKVKVEETIGQITNVYVAKSSIAAGYRECKIYIEFGYGIDRTRGSLQWLKDMTGASTYGWNKTTSHQSMANAIDKVENRDNPGEGDFTQELRDQVIDLWMEMHEQLKRERRPKER